MLDFIADAYGKSCVDGEQMMDEYSAYRDTMADVVDLSFDQYLKIKEIQSRNNIAQAIAFSTDAVMREFFKED